MKIIKKGLITTFEFLKTMLVKGYGGKKIIMFKGGEGSGLLSLHAICIVY